MRDRLVQTLECLTLWVVLRTQNLPTLLLNVFELEGHPIHVNFLVPPVRMLWLLEQLISVSIPPILRVLDSDANKRQLDQQRSPKVFLHQTKQEPSSNQ